MRFKTEAELAEIVIAWLQTQLWTIYQEVQMTSGGPCADIVAVSGRVTWVIETKLSLSLCVLEQADHWRRWANYSSIAVPAGNMSGRHFALKIARANGIGVATVRQYGEVDVAVSPEINRMVDKRFNTPLIDRLTEDHKTFAKAGNADGARFTPYANTCRSVAQIVASEPGISMKHVIDRIRGKHHYSNDATARSCLLRWAEAGSVKGVRVERNGRAISLFPTP